MPTTKPLPSLAELARAGAFSWEDRIGEAAMGVVSVVADRCAAESRGDGCHG